MTLEITPSKKPQYSEEQRKKHCQDYQASKLSTETAIFVLSPSPLISVNMISAHGKLF